MSGPEVANRKLIGEKKALSEALLLMIQGSTGSPKTDAMLFLVGVVTKVLSQITMVYGSFALHSIYLVPVPHGGRGRESPETQKGK